MIERKKCFCGGTSTRYDRDVRGNWWFGFRCMTCKWETGVLETMDDACRAWNSDIEDQIKRQRDAMLTSKKRSLMNLTLNMCDLYLRPCFCGSVPVMIEGQNGYAVTCNAKREHSGLAIRSLFQTTELQAIESWEYGLENLEQWMKSKPVNVFEAMEERYGMPKPRKCWCGREPMIAQGGDSSLWKAYCQNDCHNPGGYMTDGFDTINGVIASWNQKVERDIAKFIEVNA